MVRWHHHLNEHEFVHHLREMVEDWKAWQAAVHRVAKSQT